MNLRVGGNIWRSLDNVDGAEWSYSGLPANMPALDMRVTDTSGQQLNIRRARAALRRLSPCRQERARATHLAVCAARACCRRSALPANVTAGEYVTNDQFALVPL